MNEPTVPQVKPYPETLMLFDRADDAAIANRLTRGAILREYVYAFKQSGQMIYGLGVDGAEACKRELAKTGEVIREDDIVLMKEDAETAYFKAFASRWVIRENKEEKRLDTVVELKRQPKFITRRNGELEANPFWFEQGGSKAMRNAILNLIPEDIKQRVVRMYKDEAKVVEMTPEVGDAMTHEANASFKEKDERAALVKRLQDRWRELELTRSQVHMILVKRGLSKLLATADADWSTVDLAIIQDLLAEAS
jgi:hypothetical protein